MRLVGLLATLLVACVNSDSVVCSDGTICPNGTICATVTQPDQTLCVVGDQLGACTGQADHVACTTPAIAKGRCYDGVCLAVACGNGRVDSVDPAAQRDTGELCDDGNNISGDGCSADCLSDEKCGNGVVDGVTFEQCDDGNLVDHDGCTSTCTPEVPRWHPIAIDQIPARSTTMVYDAEHEQIVLFGGSLNAGGLGDDTWLWNGLGWVAASPASSPSAREGHAMAYDAKRHRVVLFGGSDPDEQLADTWEWDGEVWTQVSTTVAPPPRLGAAMAFDAKRGRVVLFGGLHYAGLQTGYYGDTWEYDGTAWTHVATANPPLARGGAAMGYDPIRQSIVLFGGGNQFATFADTYEYDGTDWHHRTPATSPGIRGGARMAWDASANQLVMFGGDNGAGTDLDETWSWTGTTWVQYTGSPKPASRSGHAMAFDGARHDIVVFGGNSEDPPTTWTFRSNSWQNLDPRPPAALAQTQVAFDSERGRAVVVDDQSTTWESDGKSWTKQPSGGPSPHRTFPAITYDVAHKQTVLFGGFSDSSVTLGDTWTWNGATWTQKSPSGSPTARQTAMVYDATRGNVILFGGTSDPSAASTPAFDDTYAWDGTKWSLLSPAHKPPARSSHAMIYDPIRRNIVLFGGRDNNASTVRGDTWTWDGTDWTEQHPATAPSARQGAGLAWNASRERLTLFGGFNSDGYLSDVWEWDGTTWTPVAAGTSPRNRERPAIFRAADGGGIVMYGGTTAGGSGVPIDLDDACGSCDGSARAAARAAAARTTSTAICSAAATIRTAGTAARRSARPARRASRPIRSVATARATPRSRTATRARATAGNAPRSAATCAATATSRRPAPATASQR